MEPSSRWQKKSKKKLFRVLGERAGIVRSIRLDSLTAASNVDTDLSPNLHMDHVIRSAHDYRCITPVGQFSSPRA